MKRSFIVYLAYTLTMISSGCKQHEVQKESPFVNEVPANTDFYINLPEDHRTGYNWLLVQDYDTTAVQRLNEVWHGNEKGINFNLHALAMGQTTLNFVKRKFTDTADNKHFILKIVPK